MGMSVLIPPETAFAENRKLAVRGTISSTLPDAVCISQVLLAAGLPPTVIVPDAVRTLTSLEAPVTVIEPLPVVTSTRPPDDET